MISKYMKPTLYGLIPYMVFMGEICDRKVLHNVVFTSKLLFDPLYSKFLQENKNFLKKLVYIGKTWKVVILWI